jgi:hypothetical protein
VPTSPFMVFQPSCEYIPFCPVTRLTSGRPSSEAWDTATSTPSSSQSPYTSLPPSYS